MGLDMYLHGRVKKIEREEHEGYPIDSIHVQLAYWRKHWNLHGFIVKNFAEGVDDCKPVYLLPEDVEKILRAVKDDELPHTKGFLFGTSDKSEAQRAEDVAVFEGALAWLKAEKPGEERLLFYRASW